MSSFSFMNYSLLSPDISGGAETLIIPPSTTFYTAPFNITHLDSVNGLFISLVGTRYGPLATDCTVTIQQAMLPINSAGYWSDIGTATNIGTAGDIVTPEAVNTVLGVYPLFAESLMNNIRLKFVTSAASSIVLSKLFRSSRGRG